MARRCLGSVQNGPGVLWERLKWPRAPREHPKRPGCTSGAFETARVCVGSIRNGLGAPGKHPKRPEGTSVASETAQDASGASEMGRGHLGSN